MDFHALLAKMQQLDRAPTEIKTAEACGDPMTAMPPTHSMPAPETPPTPPPSMSVNLNAQGIDNIKDMLALMMKVNPDMAPKTPMSAISSIPNMMTIEPMDSDADNDGKIGGELDISMDKGITLDRDNDGDHDMGDHRLEPKDKSEAWENEPDEEEKDVDYILNKVSGGMNKKHGTYPKVADGDNPMQKITRMENEDLRTQIKNDLRKRLAEMKGAK
jgi:hypothetical protein